MINNELGFNPGDANLPENQIISPLLYFYDQPLLPPSKGMGEGMLLDEFRDKYPLRYDIWEASQNPFPSALEESTKKRNLLQMANNLDRYDRSHYTGKKKLLRYWQIAAFDNLAKCVELGYEEASVEATMGAGKTRFFIETARAVDLPTVIVTSRKNLVEQIYEEAKEVDTELEVGRFYQDVKEIGRKIIITTYDSLPQIDPESAKFLVLDEAHRARGENRIQNISRFRNSFILAVSATLGVNVEGEDRVARAINNRIHTLGIPEAVAEGYNCGFRCVLARVKADVNDIKTTTGETLTEEQIERVKEEKIVRESILPLYLELKKRHEERYQEMGLTPPPFTTLAYTKFVDNGRLLAKIFQEAGIPSLPVWGTMSKDAINGALAQLRTGELALAANAQLFREGTDIRSTRLILNTGDTNSLTSEMQRCGRGLRTDPDDPYKETVIVDVVYEDKDNSRQALFPNLVGASQLQYLDSNPSSVNNGEKGGGGKGIDLSNIEVEGITVVTDTEEVLSMAKQIVKEEYDPIPEGAMVIGNQNISGTLANLINRNKEWVKQYILLVISEIEKEWNEQGVPPEERAALFGEHLGATGIRTYYYLPVVERLQELVAKDSKPPEGAMIIGEKDLNGTLSNLLNKSKRWIMGRIPIVISEIEKEWNEQGVPPEERAALFGEHLGATGIRTYYYLPVVERLQELVAKDSKPPEGAMIIGEKDLNGTLSNLLNRGKGWINSRIPIVISEIEKEWNEQGVPPEERAALFGDHPSANGKISTFYYLPIIERLQELAAKDSKPPEGAMVIGDKDINGTLSNLLNRNTPWINSRIPIVISEIEKEWNEQGVPPEERAALFGEHLTATGIRTYYYLPIIERLQELAAKDSKPPEGAMVIGNISNLLNRSRKWINSRIPIVISEIEKEWNEQGVPPEERAALFGEHLGAMGKIAVYYYLPVIERLLQFVDKDN